MRAEPTCAATIYRHGLMYQCDLKPGHEPPHVDTWDGREWR